MTTKQLERRLVTILERKARLRADLTTARTLEAETRAALRQARATAKATASAK